MPVGWVFPELLLGWALRDYEILRFGRTDLGHDDILIADFVVWARVVKEDLGNGDVRFRADIL